MSESLLEKIAQRVRERIGEGAYAPGADRAQPPEGARFEASLREPGTRIIAEIKHRSPSAGLILENADRKLESLALAYRRGHAAAISAVTERDFFGGDPEWIGRAKRISGLPVLMKDFFIEESQVAFAAACGADAVLLIAALLPDADLRSLARAARARAMAVLVEAHDEQEIARAVQCGEQMIGVNARDLRTFDVNLDSLKSLSAKIPDGLLKVAESGIRSRQDVELLSAAGFHAFLVGESLLRSGEPEEALRALRGEK